MLRKWDRLPDIQLYMDQLLAIIEKELQPLLIDNSKPCVTASMVNNYVKHKIMPPPLKKRYDKKHISCLLIISILKSILSIGELAQLITGLLSECDDNWEFLHDYYVLQVANTAQLVRTNSISTIATTTKANINNNGNMNYKANMNINGNSTTNTHTHVNKENSLALLPLTRSKYKDILFYTLNAYFYKFEAQAKLANNLLVMK